MKNRKAILVDDPNIGNEEAIERLGALARDVDVTVLVAPGDVSSLQVGSEIDLGELFLEEEQRRAEHIVDQLKQLGIEATAKVRVGVRPIEIIREVLETEASFVIKVAEGGGTRMSIPGSTDSHLLRQCPCPVWITQPRERSPYQRVFAAIDPQEDRPGRDSGLDGRILRWALEICREDQAQLTILHAWDRVDEGLLRGRGGLPTTEVERLIGRMKVEHEGRIQQLLETLDLSGVDHTIQLVRGRPAEVIPTAVYCGRADVLVMGTLARTGIAGFFIGNTAERVIPQLGCAILAVKPEGFVSPVGAA